MWRLDWNWHWPYLANWCTAASNLHWGHSFVFKNVKTFRSRAARLFVQELFITSWNWLKYDIKVSVDIKFYLIFIYFKAPLCKDVYNCTIVYAYEERASNNFSTQRSDILVLKSAFDSRWNAFLEYFVNIFQHFHLDSTYLFSCASLSCRIM